jgi:hypothetical protein
MELFLEFLLDCVLEIAREVILGLTHALNEDDAAWPLAILWFIMIGLALGAASTLVADGRLLREGPFPGVSLLVVPVLLGAVMTVWGSLRSRSAAISHLATWYGGASMGVGLAGGRLCAMLLLKAA